VPNDNYNVVVVDSLVNAVEGADGVPVSIRRVETITGKSIPCYKLDIRDRRGLEQGFENDG